jgi:hypothetical protein
MSEDQENLIADLRRKGQAGTANRVAKLSPTGFEHFKRDLLHRYAADGDFRD